MLAGSAPTPRQHRILAGAVRQRRLFVDWLIGLVLVVGLVGSACSSSDPDPEPDASQATTASTQPATQTTQASATTTSSGAPTSAPANAPIEAAAPPPPSFDEVEDEYRQGVEGLLAEGRAVADQLLADDAEGVHARFAASFAAQVPVEEWQAFLDGVNAQAPLTGRGTDRALPQGPNVGTYVAELDWGQEILTMTAVLDESGAILSLLLTPQPTLPPDPSADYESEVAFALPFEGLWFVVWGGATAIENYHVIAADQRHAYDILVWRDGGTHSGDSSVNENYWAYGQPVLAPAAGTVVTAVDGLPDQVPQESTDAANPAGNHVVIEVADGEYLLIAHLQPGSLSVAEGDTVERGQQIGLVGNSGNTSEPHIHIHLQDQPMFDPTARGLPLAFTGYRADGLAVERGAPLADQFIAPS